MQTKLSIIVPIYNVEPYIYKCLDSLINQTLKNIEIICIDDGSPDNCGVICDEYAKNPEIIFKIIHKKNEGVVAARNDGIALAAGEYLTFVDSDDWVDLDYYERMIKALDNSGTDVLCSGGRYVESFGKTQIRKAFDEPVYCVNNKNRADLISRTLMSRPTKSKNKILYDLGFVWDKIYRTSFIKEKILEGNNNYQYGIWEDALFELNVFSKASTIVGCLEIGYHYRRESSNSATSRFWENMPDICRNWADNAYKLLENDPAFKEKVLQDAFLARCRMMLFNTIPQYFANVQNQAPYREKLREFRQIKKERFFKEALHRKTPFDSKIDLIILIILNLPGFLPVRIIEILRKIKYKS